MFGGILNGEAKGRDGFLRDYILFSARIGSRKIVFPSTIKGRAILGFRVLLRRRSCISSGDGPDDERHNGLTDRCRCASTSLILVLWLMARLATLCSSAVLGLRGNSTFFILDLSFSASPVTLRRSAFHGAAISHFPTSSSFAFVEPSNSSLKRRRQAVAKGCENQLVAFTSIFWRMYIPVNRGQPILAIVRARFLTKACWIVDRRGAPRARLYFLLCTQYVTT